MWMNEVRFEFGFHGWLEFWTGVANEWEIHISEAEIVGYVTHIISEDWSNSFEERWSVWFWVSLVC